MNGARLGAFHRQMQIKGINLKFRRDTKVFPFEVSVMIEAILQNPVRISALCENEPEHGRS